MWFTYFETATGNGLSISSTNLDPLPAGIGELATTRRPNTAAKMWDSATRTYIDRPVKVLVDRIQDFANEPEIQALLGKLNATERAALRRLFGEYIGRNRLRNVSEPGRLE